MQTMRMIQITTDDGSRISVEADADQVTIAILKAVSVCRFSEWHYTGNSPNGDNTGNYDDLEAWFRAAGLTIKDDDFSWLHYSMPEGVTGVDTLAHRGKTIRFHAQVRRGGESNQFGYRTIVEYRLIGVS